MHSGKEYSTAKKNLIRAKFNTIYVLLLCRPISLKHWIVPKSDDVNQSKARNLSIHQKEQIHVHVVKT